jgi:hypothetical protein
VHCRCFSWRVRGIWLSCLDQQRLRYQQQWLRFGCEGSKRRRFVRPMREQRKVLLLLRRVVDLVDRLWLWYWNRKVLGVLMGLCRRLWHGLVLVIWEDELLLLLMVDCLLCVHSLLLLNLHLKK